MNAAAQLFNKAPGWTSERQCFYSGTAENPIYVDYFPAFSKAATRLPLVMLHGGFHTGAGYISTPDGRSGWADYFAKQGYAVYVADWPGHGRSPASKEFATLSMHEIVRSFDCLLQEIGSAIILCHSASGPIAWKMTANNPSLVAAIIGIAPGPAANIQPALPDDPVAIAGLQHDQAAGCPIYSPVDKPVWVDRDFIQNFWANSPRFPQVAFESYARSIVPESASVLNERFHIGGKGLSVPDPSVVSDRPILIVTGEVDPRHPRETDARVAEFFKADHMWLPDLGVLGNGHMLMLENNSDEIAGLISQWLQKKLL
jgi:pimeloyl-ACP methyl ester carboxylesterase